MFSGILEFFKKIWERTPFHESLDVWNNSMLIDLSVIGYWILLLGLLLVNSLFSTDIQNDGKITAADIAQMNLRQCDMAVLSACNTGLGGKGSDGIFGLQRGFKNAGVRSLLMSLRPVYDESTAKLMTAFYEGISQGKSKRQSLLDAQNAIKAMGYKEGKYWASFILLDGLK